MSQYCRVAFAQCLCGAAFRSRRGKTFKRYCSTLCAAQALVRSQRNKIHTIEQALAKIANDQGAREMRRSYHDRYSEVPRERRAEPRSEPWKRPVSDSHLPGSIAFVLLYGDRRQGFSRGDGGGAGRGRGRNAIQVGGPNL